MSDRNKGPAAIAGKDLSTVSEARPELAASQTSLATLELEPSRKGTTLGTSAPTSTPEARKVVIPPLPPVGVPPPGSWLPTIGPTLDRPPQAEVQWQCEAADGAKEQEKKSADSEQKGSKPKSPNGPPRKTVLVVDDDPTMRMLLKIGLDSRLYDCVEAEHGQAAQEVLKFCRPDAIIVDLLMPVMDGLSFIQWLRQSAQNQTPVLAVSNLNDPKVEDQAIEAGANGLLRMPVKLHEVVAEIDRLVNA